MIGDCGIAPLDCWRHISRLCIINAFLVNFAHSNWECFILLNGKFLDFFSFFLLEFSLPEERKKLLCFDYYLFFF